MTINRKKLTEILIQETNFLAKECSDFVDILFETIAETLERGEEVKISGFGVFRVREKRARKGRNPKTGEKMELSARRVVKFKTSTVVRKKMGAFDQESH